MELRQLKYFVTVATELNFSRAAEKLFITQGTLSQQIKQLEIELGSDLFERDSHSVILTEAGTELLGCARRTLDAAGECSQVVADLRHGLTGTLNIGATESFSHLLKGTVKDFIRLYPGVRVNLMYATATYLMDRLRERRIDLMVSFKPMAANEDIEAVPLFSSRLAVVMRRGHPLADRKSLTLAELRPYRFALLASGMQSRKAVENFVSLESGKLDISLVTNDPNILMDILSSTDLLSIVSTLAVSYRPELVAVPLARLDVRMMGCVQTLGNSYRKRSADIFIQMLLDSAAVERVGMEE